MEMTPIGISNFDELITIHMEKTFQEVAKESLELSSSCMLPNTKSSSPSMMLHQLVSIMICKAISTNVSFENYSSYTPDIEIIEPKILIDITSDNLQLKLSMMPRRKNSRSAAISKYVIINKFVEETDDIRLIKQWSRANDSKDINFIYNLINLRAEQHKSEMLYDKSTLEFFNNGVDPLGRSIDEHTEAVKEIMIRRANNSSDIKVQRVKAELYQATYKYILKVMEIKVSPISEEKENKYFCLPGEADRYLCEYDDPSIEKVLTEEMIEGSVLKYRTTQINDKILFKFTTRLVPIPFKMYNKLVIMRNDKQEKLATRVQEINNHLNQALYDPMVCKTVIRNISNRLKAKINKNNKKEFLIGDLNLTPSRGMTPCDVLEKTIPLMSMKSFSCTSLSIDYDHYSIFQALSIPDSYIEHLKTLRDYQEARFKSRIAIAISTVRSSDKQFEVSHFKYNFIKARVIIKGQLFERDKGMAIVSYMVDDCLYRTEKWQLPDLESNLVNHHRIAMLVAAMYKNRIMSNMFSMIRLYARIIVENSWSSSRYLKIFRYLTTGACVQSPLMKQQSIKMAKQLAIDPLKLSMLLVYAEIKKRLESNIDLSRSTIIFGLKWEQLGWEAFLCNLCPSKTYGHEKHLKDICVELFDELDLYNNSLPMVKNLYSHFSKILTCDKNLKYQYEQHFSRIDDLCSKTDDRFSYSPVSNLMIRDVIKDMNVSYKSVQNSLPHITELMTARSSFDTTKCEKTIALKSISSLIERHSTISTSLMTLKLLNSQDLDLSMWLFDKDQIGGNREISVLSSDFRVLQKVAESVAENIAKSSDVDFLHKNSKESVLSNRFQSALEDPVHLYLTADQTRWGPNFNTCTFGFMFLLFSQYTTEFFIPAIICFLSEFKIFEVPMEFPCFYNKITDVRKFPGALARSHMGQGIFHQCSSLYHSLVIKYILKIKQELTYRKFPDLESYPLKLNAMVTSDDLCIMDSIPVPDIKIIREDKERYNRIQRFMNENNKDYEDFSIRFYCNIQLVLKYCGIKTSNYKNWVSFESLEFNSLFFGKTGYGPNDIKFIYSYMDPATTGNFYDDYMNSIGTYYDAGSAGCSIGTMNVLPLFNFIKVCRQWKMDSMITGLPSIDTIRQGRISWISPDNILSTNFKTWLHFKTRGIEDDILCNLKEINNPLFRMRFNKIKETRQRTAYRSCLTYCKDHNICNLSPYFTRRDSIGCDFEYFARNQNQEPDFIKNILHPNERHSTIVMEERETGSNLYEVVTIRKTIDVSSNFFEYIAGASPPVTTVSAKSSNDELMLHIMRSYRKVELAEDVFGLQGLSIEEQVSKLADINEKVNSLPKATRIIFNKDKRNMTYKRINVMPPVMNCSQSSTVLSCRFHNIDYSDSYSEFTSYVGILKTNESSLISQSRSKGTKMCIYKDEVTVIIHEPNYIDLSRHFTINISELESQYSAGRKVYLNIKVSRELLDRKIVRNDYEDEVDEESKKRMDDIIIKTQAGVLDLKDKDLFADFDFDDFGVDDDELYEDDDEEKEEDIPIKQRMNNDILDIDFEDPDFTVTDEEKKEDEDDEDDDDQRIFTEQLLLEEKSKGDINYISIPMDLKYNIYTRDFYSKRIILCYIIKQLIDNNGILCNNILEGYFYNSINSSKIITTDIHLFAKINDFIGRTMIRLRNSTEEAKVDRDIMSMLINDDFIEDEYIKYISPLIGFSTTMFFSNEPIGEIVTRDEYLINYIR